MKKMSVVLAIALSALTLSACDASHNISSESVPKWATYSYIEVEEAKSLRVGMNEMADLDGLKMTLVSMSSSTSHDGVLLLLPEFTIKNDTYASVNITGLFNFSSYVDGIRSNIDIRDTSAIKGNYMTALIDTGMEVCGAIAVRAAKNWERLDVMFTLNQIDSIQFTVNREDLKNGPR